MDLGMKVTAFLLADHAEAVNGKLYVVGGCWNTLSVGQLPASHPHMSVCVALEVPWDLTNQRHKIEIQLVDADGRDVGLDKIEGEFEAGRPPGMRAGDASILVLVLNVNNLEVRAAGNHEWVLWIDGEPLARALFRVLLVEAAG